MSQCIAYVRVSSREQGKSGFGLEEQAAQLEAYSRASGSRIVQIYKEVGSAIGGDTLKDRPELRGGLQHARQLGCPLLISELDRLSRDAREIEDLILGSGVEIVDIKGSPDKVVRMRVEAARVQKRTELLKERVRGGLERAKERGVVFGNRTNLPEAQKKGAQANRNAAIVRQHDLTKIIAGIPGNKNMSGSEIARQLNQIGSRTSRGKEWTDQNLRRVLRTLDRASKGSRQEQESSYADNPDWGSWS